jgi:hypothetical protein
MPTLVLALSGGCRGNVLATSRITAAAGQQLLSIFHQAGKSCDWLIIGTSGEATRVASVEELCSTVSITRSPNSRRFLFAFGERRMFLADLDRAVLKELSPPFRAPTAFQLRFREPYDQVSLMTIDAPRFYGRFRRIFHGRACAPSIIRSWIWDDDVWHHEDDVIGQDCTLQDENDFQKRHDVFDPADSMMPDERPIEREEGELLARLCPAPVKAWVEARQADGGAFARTPGADCIVLRPNSSDPVVIRSTWFSTSGPYLLTSESRDATTFSLHDSRSGNLLFSQRDDFAPLFLTK